MNNNSKVVNNKTEKKQERFGRKHQYFIKVQPNLDRIIAWRKQGMTEAQIYTKLGIASSTWEKYKLEFVELMEVLKNSKEILIEQLEASLFQIAMGYEYEESKETKVLSASGDVLEKRQEVQKKQSLPNMGAIAFALKNLSHEKWKDKRDVQIEGAIENKTEISLSEYSKEELLKLASDTNEE